MRSASRETHRGFHAAEFGFVAGGGHHAAAHQHGLAAQLRIQHLLDGSEEGVHIHVDNVRCFLCRRVLPGPASGWGTRALFLGGWRGGNSRGAPAPEAAGGCVDQPRPAATGGSPAAVSAAPAAEEKRSWFPTRWLGLGKTRAAEKAPHIVHVDVTPSSLRRAGAESEAARQARAGGPRVVASASYEPNSAA